MSLSKQERAIRAGEIKTRIDAIGEYRKITNAPEESKPYLMKELFGKNGIMNALAPLKGFGISKFKELAERINKKTLSGISEQQVRKHYLGDLSVNFEGNPELKSSKLSKLKGKSDQLNRKGRELRGAYSRYFPAPLHRPSNTKHLGLYCVQFVENTTTKEIGIMLKNGTAIFEPQDKIEEFYGEWVVHVKEWHELCDKFASEFLTESIEEAKKIIRYVSDYSDFINYVKEECGKYLKAKGKGNGKPEDDQKIRFAKICAELEYKPPNEEEIYENVKKAKARYVEKHHLELVRQLKESAQAAQDATPKTISVTVQQPADSAAKPPDLIPQDTKSLGKAKPLPVPPQQSAAKPTGKTKPLPIPPQQSAAKPAGKAKPLPIPPRRPVAGAAKPEPTQKITVKSMPSVLPVNPEFKDLLKFFRELEESSK